MEMKMKVFFLPKSANMTSSEKFHLVWNNFSDNASQSIHGLRGDTDFTDVTLVGEDRRQVEAHRVILASSSPFFKEVLKGVRHPHPLLYMKGVNECSLTSLLDFIYNGEVRLEQARLHSFLALAEELEVKGLVKDDSREEIIVKEVKNDSYDVSCIAQNTKLTIRPRD